MTSWRTADLTGYAARSEVDPHYLGLDDPAPRDTRSDEQKRRDDNTSRAAWGLPSITDERSTAA